MQLAKLLEQKSLSKSDMALTMKTTRASVDRMLDAGSPLMSLTTPQKPARKVGQRVKLELIPA
ncbi:MAG: hypothetical protein ABSA47_10415 [Verrucomicrobiota bacterium]|jgi:hypothetical protein